MHDAYDDIRSRIPEEPVWYDVDGVPRYDQPHVPLHLMGRIKCQSCGQEFWVSLTDNIYHMASYEGVVGYGDSNVEVNQEENERLTEKRDGMTIVRNATLEEYDACKHLRLRSNWHYGDAPRHDGCVGETMNSIPEYEWSEYFPERTEEALKGS